MKRFIFSVLCVSVFFVGLGFLVEKVGARLKSDEKALALIKAARTAIGGDSSIAGVQSLRIKGTTTHVFKIDGGEKTEPGETEIAILLPDKLSKTVKIGNGDEPGFTTELLNHKVESVTIRKNADGTETVGKGEGQGLGVGTEPGVKTVVIRKGDGSAEDLKRDERGNVIVLEGDRKVAVGEGGEKLFRIEHEKMEAEHAAMKQNELFRLTLGLLLSPPAGVEVNYTFGGETEVDGTPCNVVGADLGGRGVKLFLNKNSNLPVMMAYEGEPIMMVRFDKEVPAPGNDSKDVIFFRQGPEPASAPLQVRFSDYRNVNGVLLPYHWTTTGGDMREEFDITSYEVNPSDIANSFQNQKVMLRTKKEGQ
jgi:hypothetical protein